MSIDAIKERLPEFAKDQKLNLGTVISTPDLTPVQAWGTALSCAVAARNPFVLKELAEEARASLDEANYDAALAAATVMGMNNVYYRFTHFIEESDKEYSTMPARLRMNVIGRHGADKLDFELWCLAVSSINGCQACVVSHEKVCRDKGASKATIQAAVKIAAVVKATADAMFAVDTLAGV